MRKLKTLFTVLFLAVLGLGNVWGADVTGTITFGTNNVKIDKASVTGDDDQSNSWTITTVGTSSFTANNAYYQVGSSKAAATSITFTTTLPASKKITAMSAKFGGFSNTAGAVTLKVGETSVATGSLNATNDVTVSTANTFAGVNGTVLTVTVTGIAKGVKVYNISYTYENGTTGGGDPEPVASFTVSPTSIDFGSKEQGATVDAQDVTVTLTNTDYAIATLSGTNAAAFEIVVGEELTATGTVSVRPIAALAAGTYTASLDVEADGVTGTKSVALTLTVTAPATPTEVTNLDGSITYNFSTFTQANDVTFDGTNYTIEFHKNSGSTAPQWNPTASEARVYAAGSVVVKAAQGYTITKIVYDYTVNANSKGNAPTVNGAAGSANAGTWNAENTTWTGNDATVTLSTSGTAGNLGFKTITVTLEEVTVADLIAIQADGTPAEFWKGGTFNHNGITVTALWDDDNETDVTSECEFSGYDMATPGQQTVTVTYQGETTTYDIEVKTIANTQAEAYTVAQARALIDAGKDLASEVYVKGTVSEIVTAWSDQYNNITYNISEDGKKTSTQFQLYRCATNGYGVGDDVVAYGKLTKYSSTYELAAGNTIVAAEKKATLEIADITVAEGEDIIPEITTNIVGEYAIEYVSNNEEVVLADDELVTMGQGSATITATIVADGYKTAETTFKVTVTTNATLESVAISGELENATYTYGDAFSKAGLTANAHYSDGSDVDVTSTATWTFNGESALTLTASGDVNVVATFEGTASAAKVCAVTVNKKASSIAIENIELEATRTATIKATTTPAGAELTYTIEEGDAYISIEDGVITGVAEGTATVRADYAGTAEYEAASKTFTVNVVAFIPTFTWSDEDLSSDTELSTVTTAADPVSIVFAQGEGTTPTKYFNNGSATRFYKGNTLTISGKDGKLIKQVVVNYVSSYVKTLTPNVGTYSVVSTTGTWSGLAGTIVLTNDEAVCRFNSIVVSYVDGTTTTLLISDMSLKTTDEPQTIVYESNKVNPVIVYSDYDEAVITIADGKVTPVTEGNTTVTATIAQEGTYTAASTTFTVTVASKTVTTLSFPEAAYSVKANETFVAPTLTTSPADLTGVKYTSSNTAAAEVDENTGSVTVKAEGTTTITATFAETADYKASEASYELTVLDPYADVLTADGIGVTSYGDWNDKTFTTATKYAGNSTKGAAPNAGAIQIRTKNSNSGIVSTETIGYIKSVSVDFNAAPSADKSLDIYGSHVAYASAADLYDNNKCGTKIGSATESGVVTLAEGDYEYIGVRSSDGAMYLNSISISWTPVTFLNVSVVEAVHGSVTVDKTSCLENAVVTITATPDEDYELTSLKAYKTGDETTEVTISEESTFTMPAYDVTVAATFTLKEFPELTGDRVAMVVAYSDKYYAISTTASSNYMSAVEVNIVNGKAVVATEAVKEGITWIYNTTADGYIFQTEAGKYLSGTNSTDLKLSATKCEWQLNANGVYYRTVGSSNRAPYFNGTSDFRNYADVSEGHAMMLLPIVVISADAVAIIGENAYATLAEAVAAANTNDEIVLLADVEENIVVPAGKTFTLDLNGRVLNGAQTASTATIKNLGTLTIKNGTVKRAGAGSASYYIIENEGTMTLNCNVSGSASSSLIRNNAAEAQMTFEGGEYTQTGAFIVVKNDLGEVIINDGTFTTANDKNVLNNWDQMTINGGTFNGCILNGAYDTNNNTLTINDGTFNSDKIRTYLGNGQTDANIVIKGGEFTSESLVYQGPTSADDAQIAISGGTFHTAVPAVYCADDFQPKANGDGTYGVQPAEHYTRVLTGFYAGDYGTICLEKAATPANELITYFRILYRDNAVATSVTYIMLEEVTEGLEAGVPYIFQTSVAGATLDCVLSGEAVSTARSVNGLVGSFGRTEIAASTAEMHNFIITAENKLGLVGSNTAYVGKNRAYIHMEGIDTEDNAAPVAGRRRVAMGNASTSTTTGMENALGNEEVSKVMINGQLFIIRGEKMYNVEGQLVK